MLHTANTQQIRDGLVTDVYFERTEKILRAKGVDKTALPIGQRPSLCKCGFEKAEILKPILSKGQMKAMLPEPKEIRDYVIDQL